MANNQQPPRSDMVTRRRLLQLLGGGSAALAATPLLGPVPRVSADPLSLTTRLTQQYGLAYPFVAAGMGFVALPQLVAAVSNAGGLGVLGVAPEPPPAVGIRVSQIRALTSRPFGLDFFVDTASPPIGETTVDGHISEVVAAKTAGAPIAVVVFHFNPPKPQWVTTLQAAGVKVWIQVPSVAAALEGLNLGGTGVRADALVVQGREAGGHNKSLVPLGQLLRDVRRAVGSNVLLVAAGGIARGVDVVEAMTHGAEGVWVGSRLVASTEAHAHPEYKQRLVAAGKKEAVTTTLFGPELPCRSYRVLRTQVVDQSLSVQGQVCNNPANYNPPLGTTTLFPGLPFEAQGVPVPQFSALVPTPETVSRTGSLEAFGMPAGDGIQHIRDIRPAGAIIADMMAEARALLAAQSAR
jgi:NAD(P)H-dependent flavin oxidoreductase YrpB (nitropropane dioxygenase family)